MAGTKPGHDKETSGVLGMTNRVELAIAERFPFADGHEFGDVGAYERVVGRAHFAADPDAPAQQGITDIDKAPVDAEGLVRFRWRFLDPEAGRSRARQPADLFRLRQPRQQADAAILQRRAGVQRPAHPGACRKRLSDAARLHRRMARLAGRPAAGERADGARSPDRAGGNRARPGRVHRRSAGTDNISAERPCLDAEPSDRIARHPRSSSDAPPLSGRRAEPGAARALALCASRRRGRPRQSGRRARRDPVGHAYPHPRRLRAGLDLRADLYRPRPAGARARPCGRARFCQLPAI